MRATRWLGLAALPLVLLLACGARGGEDARTWLAERLGRGDTVVAGRDGWLFLPGDLRALAVPDLASLSPGAGGEADPLPAIVDFAAQVRRAGAELLLVPVPPKPLVYPETLLPAGLEGAGADLGTPLAELYAELARRGVPVLDLLPALRAAKGEGRDPLYCRTDTHWAPRGIAVAAAAVADRIGRPEWLAAVPRREVRSARRPFAIEGDLRRLLPEPRPEPERLELISFAGPDGEPLAPWRESPVLLLGDSHALVFHAGAELHARGAGLADHLAGAWGVPVDLVAVRGSGGTPARVNLLRRGDSLAGKRLVVWVFAARELAAGQGWKLVPVVR
jgi:alginate O-acetyltransferase complex protein AlgJ